jgi:hypothetical protein
MTFENLNNDENRITYEKESEDYAGDDITVIIILNSLNSESAVQTNIIAKNLKQLSNQVKISNSLSIR